MDDLLDQLPLEVLLAMQEALADPSEQGRERARKRALDAGFHVAFSPPRADGQPLPMEEAPADPDAVILRFDGRR